MLVTTIPAGADELQAALDRGGNVTVTGSFAGNYVAPPSVTGLRDLRIDGTLKIEGGTFGAPKPIVLQAGQEKTDLSPGVWCVMDNRPASWSAWRDEYRAGEFLEVKPGGYLARPVQGSYPAIGNCVAYQLVGANPLAITGLTVRAPDDSDEPAFKIHQRVGVTVRDSTFSGGRVIVFDLNRCLHVVCDNANIECHRNPDQTTISEYGGCVHNSQDVLWVNSRLEALRHGITIGGDSLAQNIINRDIRIQLCRIASYGLGVYGQIQSCHAHGNVEKWSVEHCDIAGGVVVGGQSGRVCGNRITSRTAGQASIGVYFAECAGAAFEVSDNEITSPETPLTKTYGTIFGYLTEKSAQGGTAVFARNKITGPPARLWTSVPWQVDYRDTHPVELRGPTAIQSDGHEIRFPRTVDDCTAALQATIKSLPLNPDPTQTPKGYPTGGTIRLAPGTVRISDTVKLQRGLNLFGAGKESTQILSTCRGSVLQYLDAGRYTPDAIAIADLSIWQDSSVTPSSGAGIDVSAGPASVQAVSVSIDRVAVEGTNVGIIIAHNIAGGLRNSLVQKCKSHGVLLDFQKVSNTSFSVESTYAVLNGGDGYRLLRGGYADFRATASDSNAGYGYSLIGGSTHSLMGGAEENAAGALYLEDTRNVRAMIHAVDSGKADRSLVTLKRTVGTCLDQSLFNKVQGNGYAVSILELKDKVSVRGGTYLGVVQAKSPPAPERRWNEPGWVSQ